MVVLLHVVICAWGYKIKGPSLTVRTVGLFWQEISFFIQQGLFLLWLLCAVAGGEVA